MLAAFTVALHPDLASSARSEVAAPQEEIVEYFVKGRPGADRSTPTFHFKIPSLYLEGPFSKIPDPSTHGYFSVYANLPDFSPSFALANRCDGRIPCYSSQDPEVYVDPGAEVTVHLVNPSMASRVREFRECGRKAEVDGWFGLERYPSQQEPDGCHFPFDDLF